MRTLWIGTKNRDKLREIEEILVGLPYTLRALPDDAEEAPEDEPTLEGNAVSKATFYARQRGGWCLADDTGLEVFALGGAPGVKTARYAGPDASYADNRRKLLAALRGTPPDRRGAQFRCVVALARPSGEVVATAEGAVDGVILEAERGDGGFGYDPLFAVDGRSFAELTSDAKHALSHRARALARLRPSLLELI